MSGKNINFNDNKIKKVNFTKKKVNRRDDFDYLLAQIIHLNTLLDIKIMMLLDHYV